jgi:hypothetical protein
MRITDETIQAKIDALNSLSLSPQTPWTRNPETGKLSANVGNYHYHAANDSYNVYRHANTTGGATTPLGPAPKTRKELAAALDAYTAGYLDATKAALANH